MKKGTIFQEGKRMGYALLAFLLLGQLAFAQVTPKFGSVFNPADFSSASALNWAKSDGADLVFDTDAGTVTGYGAIGEVGVTAEGMEVMVFTFDSITLTSDTGSNVVSVTGSKPIALLSSGDITIGTALDLSGGDAPDFGTTTTVALAGLGGPGGFDGGQGDGASNNAEPGEGPGAGGVNNINEARGGGGGGHGGAGGYGCDYREAWENTTTAGGAGGPSYGNKQITALYGGSGGGGGNSENPKGSFTGGGGGGGAIEIACDGVLTITAPIDCSGGNGGAATDSDFIGEKDLNASGGGGAGGAIVLSGSSVVLSSTLDAAGGNGGAVVADVDSSNKAKEGGGGGGGRIAVYYSLGLTDSGATYSVAGGLAGQPTSPVYPGQGGEDGTVYKKSGLTKIKAPVGSLFDPADFDEAAVLNWANDSGADLVFNTDTGEVTGYGKIGQLGQSASGNVDVMVFNFASIDLTDNSGTDSVVITGSRGAALISAGNINVAVDIDISGAQAPASDGSVAPSPGGVAAVGGFDGGQGDGSGNNAEDGEGPGGGGANNSQVARGGGGGGYGGAGGTGDDYLGGTWDNSNGGEGGSTYGDALLSDLYGGSGGGGGNCEDAGAGFSGGGAGGGALALIAGGDLTVSGTLDASGGQGGDSLNDANRDASGGGGSGGALLLKGTNVTLTGTLDVSGGAGGTVTDSGNKHGGGGGGGRIAVYYETVLTDGAATYDVTGGLQGANGGTSSQDGFDGTQNSYRFPVVQAEMGSLFDPTLVPSLGALSWANDSGADLVFDTDVGTVTGAGITATAATGFSASGDTEMAVFCFDSITLTDNGGGNSVVVQGSKPLVLLSQGDAQIDVPIDVSGGAGVTGTGATSAGGAAIAGGYDGGLGGNSTSNATSGSGPGAGTSSSAAVGRGGGGASHAGTGGYGCDAYYLSNAGGPGAAYGSRYLLELIGGSGGGGGTSAVEHSGGGAGGGALSIQAAGTLTVNAAISADGGNGGGPISSTDNAASTGGGGSGGSVLLKGTTVTLASTVSAAGGSGGNNAQRKAGGGGGGGRVVVLYDTTLDDSGATLDASGGAPGPLAGSTSRNAYSGSDGTVVASKAPTAQAANKMFFSPWDFTSNGDLAWANDSGSDLVIDTEAGTIDGVEMGQVGISESGESAAMVFCFDNIALLDNSGSYKVVLQGDLPLVLLSRSDIVCSVTLDASGGDAPVAAVALPLEGGTAVLGGGAGGRADNDTNAADNGTAGTGYAPGHPGLDGTRAGGGGGYGGAGGEGADVGVGGGPGGSVYGDSVLSNLYGGSGGGGGRGGSGRTASGGGGGGGAIALIAADSLSIGGDILCEGGDAGSLTAGDGDNSSTGGGGSGGSILLRGQSVYVGGTLSVAGGFGGDLADVYKCKGGGGGGGGRIAIYSGSLDNGDATLDVTGGPQTTGGSTARRGAAGADGSLQQFTTIPFDGWTVGAIALSDADPTMNVDPVAKTNELTVQVDFGTLSGNGRDVTHMLVSTDGFQTYTSIPYTDAIAAAGAFDFTLPAMADGAATMTVALVTDLGGISNLVEDAILVDQTAPEVTSLVPASGQDNPTEEFPVEFTATFSEGVQVYPGTFSWTTGEGYAAVTDSDYTQVSGDVYTLTATTLDSLGNVEPVIAAGSYFDEAGNAGTETETGLPVVYKLPDASAKSWELY